MSPHRPATGGERNATPHRREPQKPAPPDKSRPTALFFEVPYSFWWAGILVFLALLWDSRRGADWVRLVYIAIGGLSAPIIISMSALFWLRALAIKSEREVIAAGVASFVAILQIIAIHYQPVEIHTEAVNTTTVAVSLKMFVGKFFYMNGSVYFGVAAALVLTGLAIMRRRELGRYFRNCSPLAAG